MSSCKYNGIYHFHYRHGLLMVKTQSQISMLENFPPYIRSTAIENEQVLLNELKQR